MSRRLEAVRGARQEDQTLLAALEAVSEEALGGRNWQARAHPSRPGAALSVRQTTRSAARSASVRGRHP